MRCCSAPTSSAVAATNIDIWSLSGVNEDGPDYVYFSVRSFPISEMKSTNVAVKSERLCVCARARAPTRVCVRETVCARVCVCARARVCVMLANHHGRPCLIG